MGLRHFMRAAEELQKLEEESIAKKQQTIQKEEPEVFLEDQPAKPARKKKSTKKSTEQSKLETDEVSDQDEVEEQTPEDDPEESEEE